MMNADSVSDELNIGMLLTCELDALYDSQTYVWEYSKQKKVSAIWKLYIENLN